jgi:hypothetical protein
MQWSDISFNPSNRTLRQFAGLWVLFLGGLGCWHGFGQQRWPLAAAFFLAVVAVGPIGLYKPQAIRLVYTGSMIATFPIGWMVSRVLLALLFYLVFTPIAVFFRWRGRDALHRDYLPDASTYWTPKAAPNEMRSYLRQF